jgi:hypothetical protein
MATIVKEPLLTCKRSGRWRRKKFIAILVFAFFLIGLVSYLASGKSSRKLHKNIHRLEDKFEDMEKSYKTNILTFQREIEALKLERKAPTKQNGNVTSFDTEKTLTQLKETQEEMKEQKEAMKSLFKMFESYKEETSKELSELKSRYIDDQQEIQRLQNTIKQLETQKTPENKTVNQKKESNDYKIQLEPKNPSTPPEIKPKSNSNVLARSAKAVKDYISNLAYKLNPFRGSRDKIPTNKPISQENKIPVALEGTIKKSLENVKSEQIQTEKNFALLTKDIDGTLENLVLMLNNAANLADPTETIKKIESKFHYLERVIADYVSTKLSGKDQERVLKWKKNYIPVKEQFEKIMHDNMTHGSKSHKQSSKNLQKLASTTRHFKDTLQSL